MITTEQIKESLSAFNGRADFVASDFIVARAFSEPVDLVSHFARVVILDGLFNTSLRQSRPTRGRQRLAMVTMSENIRLRLPDIVCLVEGLPARSLFGLSFMELQTRQAFSTCVRTVVECLNNNSMSFAGKYLHFTFPDLFPPWDRLVPQCINRLCSREVFTSADLQSNEPESYVRLCEQYQVIHNGLTADERVDILQHDFWSQPEAWRRTNSLVRIFDKALWMKEKLLAGNNGEQPTHP